LFTRLCLELLRFWTLLGKTGKICVGTWVAGRSSLNKSAMQNAHQRSHQGFDRVQELLLALRVGDELRASDAARMTGLSASTCRTVLEGLKRAGLMTHAGDDKFVRRTLDVL